MSSLGLSPGRGGNLEVLTENVAVGNSDLVLPSLVNMRSNFDCKSVVSLNLLAVVNLEDLLWLFELMFCFENACRRALRVRSCMCVRRACVWVYERSCTTM